MFLPQNWGSGGEIIKVDNYPLLFPGQLEERSRFFMISNLAQINEIADITNRAITNNKIILKLNSN